MSKDFMSAIDPSTEVVLSFRWKVGQGFGSTTKSGPYYGISVSNKNDPLHETIAFIDYDELCELQDKLQEVKAPQNAYNFKIAENSVYTDLNIQDVSLKTGDMSGFSRLVQVDKEDSLWSFLRKVLEKNINLLIDSQEVSAFNLRFSDSTLSVTVPYMNEYGRFRTAKVYSLEQEVETCPITLVLDLDSMNEFKVFEHAKIGETYNRDKVYAQYDLKLLEIITMNTTYGPYWLTLPRIAHTLDTRDSVKTMLDGASFGDFIMKYIYGNVETVATREYYPPKENITETNVIFEHKRNMPSVRGLRDSIRRDPKKYVEVYKQLIDKDCSDIYNFFLGYIGKSKGLLFFSLGMEMVMKSSEVGYDEHAYIVISQKIKKLMYLPALEMYRYKAYMLKENFYPSAPDWSGSTSLGTFKIKLIGGLE